METSDEAWKACMELGQQIIRPIHKLRQQKTFITLIPGNVGKQLAYFIGY
jgi:hypothetical protein